MKLFIEVVLSIIFLAACIVAILFKWDYHYFIALIVGGAIGTYIGYTWGFASGKEKGEKEADRRNLTHEKLIARFSKEED